MIGPDIRGVHKAYSDGWFAGDAGKCPFDNPYADGSEQAEYWLDGWNDGAGKDKEQAGGES